MNHERPIDRHLGVALLALAGVALALALAAPALAANADGKAALMLADHDRGRTLSGQGVTILPGGAATRQGRTLEMPIADVAMLEPDGAVSARSGSWLRFKKGKRGAALTEIRFELSTGRLRGKLGGREIDVFKVAGPATADRSSGAVGLDGGRLFLTKQAAGLLKKKLGLERVLRRNGVGMAWLSARLRPAHAAAQDVDGGGVEWGVLASWRAYVLGQQGPPASKGTIAVADGATANGALDEAGAFFGFPTVSGSYERGLYGATDRLTLKTTGSVEFAKPFHCIVEIRMADLEVVLDGADSALVVGEYGYDIDEFNGVGCNDKPAVLAPGTRFATLDLSDVTPSRSANGVTWAGIPAELTAAGAAPFAPTYAEGQPLDPITVGIEWSGPVAVP